MKVLASKLGELAAAQHLDPGDVGVDLGRAGGEVDLGGAGDAEGEAGGIVAGELVGGAQRAAGAEADPAARSGR